MGVYYIFVNALIHNNSFSPLSFFLNMKEKTHLSCIQYIIIDNEK